MIVALDGGAEERYRRRAGRADELELKVAEGCLVLGSGPVAERAGGR